MSHIPADRWPDSTLALLRDGYEFISKRCRRYGSDVFETRLLLEKFICIRGAEAAEIFYDTALFDRQDVVPSFVKKTLFGENGVQGLRGEAHLARKAMFMSLMTTEGIGRLVDLTLKQWVVYSGRWVKMGRVVLLEQAEEILTRAVCEWAGVPLVEEEVEMRARDFASMIDALGTLGPRHWRGRLGRRRAEDWIRDLIRRVRAGEFEAAEDSALYKVASYRNLDGELLDLQVAAVELLNVLRPTVGVGRFIAYAALALHDYGVYREQAAADEGNFVACFVQEVRRFYPFAPFVGARVRKDFEWRGYAFPEGRKVLLDLYGINHDGRLWDEPDRFRPERFREWEENAFDFVPQGGGDYYKNHRCPGEWIAIEEMKAAVKFLVTGIGYDVPPQDLSVDLSRIPAQPESGFMIENVWQRAGIGDW